MEENSDYFKGQWNIDRVKEWRARNPGYSKRKKKELPLQTAAFPERVEDKADTKNALQNFDSTQLFLLVGLISHITGDALQTVVLKRANYFILKGQTLLNPDLKMKGVLSNGEKNHFVGTKAENPHPI
ncbi:MAG TPA: hypothetical protein DEA27_00100 [Candidatus Moranbacteria bacterium]|nr:hypothetical protein [Candidatus Moranbacteria bacterium]